MEFAAILLAGGHDQALWPLTDEKTEKPFLRVFSDQSLLAQAYGRIAPLAPPDRQVVIANEPSRFKVQADCPGAQVLAEPVAKNTAAAALWGAIHLVRRFGPELVLAVLPADLLIDDQNGFEQALLKGVEQAVAGWVVTFGVPAARPEPGYGYLEIALSNKQFTPNSSVEPVICYHEKPPYDQAVEFLTNGNFYWHSGILLCRADVFFSQLQALAPTLYNAFLQTELDDPQAVARAFEAAPAVSLGQALLSDPGRVCTVISNFGWSDAGSFASIYERSAKDARGNALPEGCRANNSKGCMILSASGMPFVLEGVENLCIVESGGVCLIKPMK